MDRADKRGLFEAPMIVNAAGAWADRMAAMLGEPVPLEVIALMSTTTAGVRPSSRPVADPSRAEAVVQAVRERGNGL